MEEEQHANLLSAAFPGPPPFYKHFTAKNVARLKAAENQAEQSVSSLNGNVEEEPQQSHEAQSAVEGFSNLQDLPHELLYLIPPEPPSNGVYRSFGETFDVSITRAIAKHGLPHSYL